LPIEVLEVSRTLRALKGPSDRLLARKPHIAFHGQIKMVPFPFTKNLPDLGRYVHQSNVRWLYFSWLEAELRPEYMYLLDTTGAIPGLTIRHATRRYPAVLYEIGPEFGREPDWFRNDTLVAVHNLRARLLINARDAQSLVQLASIEAARGDYAQTERLLERAVRVRPGQVDLWLWLGDARLRLRKPTAADEAFVRAQLIEPQNATAQIGRGWASRNADRPQDAAALWRPVIEHARDPVTLTEMIDLYRRLGDREAEALARQTLDRLGAP
ncbi:MAG TPA: tetratricopeptide repeat protein, partial [Candidatus Limnocylindria bacterium]|nr:tetratricopeptide repeat protein [Candidatus Limnocylindria bacterium]